MIEASPQVESSPKDFKSLWFGILFIAVIHFLFATAYAHVMPYRTPGVSYHQFMHDIGAPDEAAHVEVIAYIQEKNQYPIFDPSAPDITRNYEAHQPPAYYVATAKFLDLLNLKAKNSAGYGFWGRALNSLFGSLNVAGIGILIAWLLRGSKLPVNQIALTAAGLTALIPMNLSISGSINNDSLSFALVTWGWALAALSRLLNKPGQKPAVGWPLVSMIGAGCCLGLAVLTKFSAILSIPVFVATVLWPGTGKLCLFRTGSALLVAIALFSPWMLRNQKTFGDPMMTKVFAEAFPRNARVKPNTPLKIYRLTHLLVEGVQESATGVFGYFDIHYRMVIPVIAAWLVLIFGTIGLLVLMQLGHTREIVISLFTIAMVFAALWVFNTKYNQPQARYLFMALPFLAMLPAIGLSRLPKYAPILYLSIYIILNIGTLPFLQFQYRLRTHPDQNAFQAIPLEERHRFPIPQPIIGQ